MKAIVLSSGGVDSTTCLALAIDKYGGDNVSTVTIYYGQKLDKEIECARTLADYYDVNHYEFDLSEVFKFSRCSLLKSGRDVEHSSYEEQTGDDTIISSYAPFRNGLMLSLCASLAQSLYPDEECEIYLGNHASDFAYADCSETFTEKMGDAITEGTYGRVKFESLFKKASKAEVIKKGLELNVPYELTWSCYEGKDKPCHTCASCIEREKSFEQNGVKDPLI